MFGSASGVSGSAVLLGFRGDFCSCGGEAGRGRGFERSLRGREEEHESESE